MIVVVCREKVVVFRLHPDKGYDRIAKKEKAEEK